MPLYQVVILAIVQGCTEFLPVSSSAHLALAPWLFGWKDQGLTFDIALHFGTLAAVLIYFFKDWVQVLAQGFGLSYGSDPELKKNPRLLWMLVLATIPVGALGYIFKKHAEEDWRNPLLIGCMLIGVGVLMLIAERISKVRKSMSEVSWLDSIVIGVAQALAIVPGTSRSGITITAGLFRDLQRPTAARFSFLLSTPAIAAAAHKAFWDLHKAAETIDIVPFIVGMSVSALTGCLVIAFFMRYLRTHTLRFFIYYRIIFGIIVIALAFLYRPTAG
jgi:undecaprenyl-diphosphatase